MHSMISRLNSAIFYVNDISKSLDFYTNVLGFELIENQGKFVRLKIGSENGSFLALNVEHREFQIVGKQTISVESTDIESDYRKLQSLGVKIFDELQHHSWGKYFAIEDLDGNHIDITEAK